MSHHYKRHHLVSTRHLNAGNPPGLVTILSHSATISVSNEPLLPYAVFGINLHASFSKPHPPLPGLSFDWDAHKGIQLQPLTIRPTAPSLLTETPASPRCPLLLVPCTHMMSGRLRPCTLSFTVRKLLTVDGNGLAWAEASPFAGGPSLHQ